MFIINPYRYAAAGAAFPVVEATSQGGTSSNVSSHPITMPSGVTAGDLLVVLFGQDDDGAIPATINTGSSGAGWARLYEAATASNTTRYSCFYKVANGSDTLTITTGFTDTSDWIVYRISGASSELSSAANNGTTSNDPASLTAVMGSQKYLWLVHALMANVTITAASTGYGDIINGATPGLTQCKAGSFRRQLEAATEDPDVFTTSASTLSLIATIAVPPTRVAANFPVVEEITTTAFNTSVTQHLVAMPATVNNGDLLLCHFSNDGTTAVTTPGGWNLITSNTVSSARGSYFYRVADGTEGGTTVDFVTAAGEEAAAIVHRIRQGTYQGTPEGTNAAAAASLTVNPPALTPSWGSDDMLVIGAFTSQNTGSVSSYPYPNGQTSVPSSGNTNANTDAHSCYSYASVAPVDPPTFYKASGSNTTVSMTVAVRGP